MSGESEPVADIDIDSDMTYIDLDINRERRTYIDMETATYSDIDSVNNNDTANDDTDNNDTDNNDTDNNTQTTMTLITMTPMTLITMTLSLTITMTS